MPARSRRWLRVATPPLVASALLVVPVTTGTPRMPKPHARAGEAQTSLMRAPLAFEPSAGRFKHGVQFVARGDGYALSLTRDGAVASMGSQRVRSRLVGASAKPRGERRLAGVVNWLVGDRAQWKTGIPTFGAVRYPSVYPGTDLIYHGRGGALEYDFRLAPRADPGRIALDFEPAPTLTRDGDLVLPVDGGRVRQLRPVAYQTVRGRRVPVDAAFDVSGARVSFHVGDYDRSRPLVIDPEFAFRTYAGGSLTDSVTAVAVSGTDLYAGGTTFSSDFYGAPHQVGGMTGYIMGGAATGTTRDWVTYISGANSVRGLAVDPTGNVFGVGDSNGGIPTTVGAFQTDPANNSADGFIIKLDGANGSILAATYLGGLNDDHNNAVATDSNGDVYVAGDTFSSGMATASALQTTRAFQEGFLAQLSGSLHTRNWYTYIGTTTGNDVATGVAVDSSLNSYVTGSAQGDSFTGAGNTLSQDAFLIKVASNGQGPAGFSKLLGGSSQESASGIAIDSSGNVAIAASTNSIHGPTPSDPPPFGETPSNRDALVYEVSSTGTLVHQDVIGGSGNDDGIAVAFDDLKNVYLVANSGSNDFPTQNAAGGLSAGPGPVAVKYKPSTGTIVYSTPLGANGGQDPYAAAADASGLYVGGQTSAMDFTQITASVPPLQATSTGVPDGFLAKIKASAPKIVTGPDEGSIVSSSSAGFEFGPTESGSTFKCSIDSITLATCSSPKSYTSLADGTHTVRLSLTDAGGSTDGTTATRTWKVDTTAPAAFSLTAPADGAVGDSTVNFSWQPATDANAVTYTLLVDGLGVASVAGNECSSTCSKQLTGIDKGSHTWAVRATDAAENFTDSGPRTFGVDGTPPLDFLLQSPADAALTGARPMFTWDQTTDADTAVARYELWVDGSKLAERTPAQCGGGATCSFTASSDLADGLHQWYVKAYDNLENLRQSASRSLTADVAPPTTPVLSTPAEGAELTTATPLLMWSESTDATSGVADYDVELDGTVLGLHKAPTDRTYTPPSPLSEGLHHWRVTVRDQKGNSATSGMGSFRLDTSDPVPAFTISPNPVLAGRSVTLDASTSSDAGGGRIARYEWDTDGDGAFETDGGTTATLSRTPASAGTFTFGLRVTDSVGKTATTTQTLRVTAAPVTPDQLGVSVNHGAQYTNSPKVKITLKFPASTTNVLVSNDGGFFSPIQFAPQPEIDWALDSSGPERLPKTVYVRFLIGPLTSETFTDDIILDERPPVVNQASVTPAAGAAVASASKLKKWTVKLKATDTNSGVDAVQVTANRKKPGSFLSYKTKIKVKATSRKLFVRARDRAGNLSPWKKAR